MFNLLNRKMAYLLFLGATLSSPAWSENLAVNLTTEEVKFIRQMYSQDKYMQKISAEVSFLSAFAKIASVVTPPGPAKLALQWDSALVEGWKKANSSLEKIGKLSICEQLQLKIVESKEASQLFEKLSSARGCDNM